MRAVGSGFQRGLGGPLTDGEVIDAAGLRISVLATPGHTADSLSFVLDDAVLMPKAAVLGSRNAAIAYVVRDGKAVRTPIRLGHENGTKVQVLEGVGDGDAVVVTGHGALSDGALVEVLPGAEAIAQARAVAANGAKRS